jgi:hypothetical protein
MGLNGVNHASGINLLWPNAKLSHPDQTTELLWSVVTDRKSEQNRREAARGWLQRLVRSLGRHHKGKSNCRQAGMVEEVDFVGLEFQVRRFSLKWA